MNMLTIETGGASIPALGLGIFRMNNDQVARIVPAALEAGFRHFDTAQIYGNEAVLGDALQASGISRKEFFLTTKVWVDNYTPERFARSVEESLEKLKLDYVDLLLLHWPGDIVAVSQQIEWLDAVKDIGKTRHIGVSNQNITQMRESARLSAAPIVTNQIELHPYLDQSTLLAAARDLGIPLTAYYGMADGKVVHDPVLQEIGRRHGKTAAQVTLRWLLQQGAIVLSKTSTPERLQENIAIFDFVLSDTELARIAALARPDGRLVSPAGLAPGWD